MVAMRYHRLLVSLCLIWDFSAIVLAGAVRSSSNRESRKLFGGYRITPRYCKPSKTPATSLGGPTVCMFNHECGIREGQVVGACMDGFLFGACCELPLGVSVGDLLLGVDDFSTGNVENNLSTQRPQTTPYMGITSSGVSQIAQSLLNTGLLPTAQDNEMVQINSDQYFGNAGVTHPMPDTLLMNQQDNEIDPGYFRPTQPPYSEEKMKTTLESEGSTPLLGISLSNAPLEYTTPAGFNKPMFRPKPSSKPSEDKFVLIPTISHDTSRPNKTQEYNSIVNILNMLNNTSTNRPFLSSDRTTTTGGLSSTTRIPDYKITSRQPPSTSYVFSTTIPPRRTTSTTTTKNTRPTKKKQSSKPTKKPTTSYIYSLAPTKTTFANSPSAFITSARPPSTSYTYGSSQPTRRPIQTSQVSGPGFTVTSSPIFTSKFPTPAPTVIVLGPITDNEVATEPFIPTTYDQQPATFSRPTQVPQRKPPISPVNHVTINNHVTQNIYSTSERPLPTVLITPKPSISSTLRPQAEDQDTVEVVSATPSSEDVNFPPVRHPNLNLSIPALNEDDITTPIFVEDEALNVNMESFVNKIIQDLQQPFHDLKDIVYNRNKTSSSVLTLSTTTKKPVKKQGTTSAGTTTKRPAGTTRPTRYPATASRPGTTSRPVTTKKTTVRRTTTTVTTRRPASTTTKRVRATTRKPITTTQNLIEHSTEPIVIDNDDYRTQCGIRPLVDRNGRIVGGKGAAFGEFPWQVLVRESTWLGLFTKNKCGGVLISHRYVMTAAHCQPGFLASLVAVFGEFDISGDLESKKPISRNVKRVIVHRQYDAATFENDLALLELEQPVQFDSHIIPICLPRDGDDFTGRMATVTGWGRLKYGGGVPAVLQEVQVPIMENHVCQEMFRTAGHSKVILESFLCAGYANGQKDSCEGDSGGPLVLQRPDGRYQLAGTVSHGIKCAAPYLPGVYMRTQYFKPWITSITGVTSP